MGVEVYALLIIVAAIIIRVAPVLSRDHRTAIAVLVVLAFMLAAPLLLDDFRLFQLTRIAVLVIVCVGLNMLTGYNGQISLGHGAFMLMGAYATVILMDDESQLGWFDGTPWPFYLALIVSGILAGAFGFLLGFPALRLTGPYLAIATLALMISMPSVLRKYDGLTGGSIGIAIDALPPPPGLDDNLSEEQWLYLLFLLIAVVMLLIAWSIVRGPIGRSLIAVRDSETAAAAMGINVARTKVTAFTISAFYAGIGGSLFAIQNRLAAPESIRIEESIFLLTGIVVGGLASILGSVLAAFVIFLLSPSGSEFVAKLPFITEDFVKNSGGAIQGVLVIIVILLAPFGIAGTWHRAVTGHPSGWLRAIRGAPDWAAHKLRDIRDNIIWTWEGLPWNRHRARPVEPEEGG